MGPRQVRRDHISETEDLRQRTEYATVPQVTPESNEIGPRQVRRDHISETEDLASALSTPQYRK